MSEGSGQTVSELRNTVSRLYNKAQSMKEKGEEYAGELLSHGISAGSSFTAGLIDQWKGKDLGAGIKQHRFGDVPTTFATGLSLSGLAAFGVFGKYSRVGYSGGSGFINGYANTLGRQAGQAILDKSAKAASDAAAKAEAGKTETKTEAVAANG